MQQNRIFEGYGVELVHEKRSNGYRGGNSDSVANGSYLVGERVLRVKDSGRQVFEGEQLVQLGLGRNGQTKFYPAAYLRTGLVVPLTVVETTRRAVEELVAAAPEVRAEYGASFARKTGKCCRCGRELSDPESVAGGIGPVCVTK